MNESCVIQVPLHIHSTELRTSTFPLGSKFTMTIDALKFLRHKLQTIFQEYEFSYFRK